MPLKFNYFVSSILSWINQEFVRYRIEIIRRNLDKAFPQWTEQKREAIIRKFYSHFFDWIVELAAVSGLKMSDYQKRFRCINLELLHDYYQKNKDVFILSGHYGNWEYFNCLPAFVPYQCYAMYLKQSNQVINDLIYRMRTRFGMDMLQFKEVYKMCLNRQEGKPRVIFIIGDQRPVIGTRTRTIKFLNQNTSIFLGIDHILAVVEAEILFPRLYKVKRGFYEVQFIPLGTSGTIQKAEEVINRYYQELEKLIHELPEYYLWSHNRWKYSAVNAEEKKE